MEKDSKFYKEKRIEEVLNNLLEKIIKNPDINPPIKSKKDFISDFNERCSKLNECIQKFSDDAKNKAIGFEKLIENPRKYKHV
ncbi:hypothetical protein I5Q23_22735 [Serratia marcescens]|nr:hypothetical protein [Serratia marcescens]